MAEDRIACCVPFCRRTASKAKFPDAEEIICGKHFRLASPVLRRRLSKLRRWDRRYGSSASARKVRQNHRLDWMVWLRCKKQAIERAAGI